MVMGGISEHWQPGSEAADLARVSQLRRELGSAMVVAPGCSLPDEITDQALCQLRRLGDPAPLG